MPLFHWAMPSRYHSIHKIDLVRAMVEQSDALAQGKGPAAPALKILEYKEREPFFVAGDSDGAVGGRIRQWSALPRRRGTQRSTSTASKTEQQLEIAEARARAG